MLSFPALRRSHADLLGGLVALTPLAPLTVARLCDAHFSRFRRLVLLASALLGAIAGAVALLSSPRLSILPWLFLLVVSSRCWLPMLRAERLGQWRSALLLRETDALLWLPFWTLVILRMLTTTPALRDDRIGAVAGLFLTFHLAELVRPSRRLLRTVRYERLPVAADCRGSASMSPACPW